LNAMPCVAIPRGSAPLRVTVPHCSCGSSCDHCAPERCATSLSSDSCLDRPTRRSTDSEQASAMTPPHLGVLIRLASIRFWPCSVRSYNARVLVKIRCASSRADNWLTCERQRAPEALPSALGLRPGVSRAWLAAARHPLAGSWARALSMGCVAVTAACEARRVRRRRIQCASAAGKGKPAGWTRLGSSTAGEVTAVA